MRIFKNEAYSNLKLGWRIVEIWLYDKGEVRKTVIIFLFKICISLNLWKINHDRLKKHKI